MMPAFMPIFCVLLSAQLPNECKIFYTIVNTDIKFCLKKLHPFSICLNRSFFLSFQILTSVRAMYITVKSMLSALTLMKLMTASADLDTMEMAHHASVNNNA